MQVKFMTLATALLAALNFVSAAPTQLDIKTSPEARDADSAQTGDITYYFPSDGINACGWTNANWQLVAAVSHAVFGPPNVHDGDKNSNPNCARNARVSYNGRTITVKVVDVCSACANGDIDLSPGAFAALGLNQNVGRYHGGSWWWA